MRSFSQPMTTISAVATNLSGNRLSQAIEWRGVSDLHMICLHHSRVRSDMFKSTAIIAHSEAYGLIFVGLFLLAGWLRAACAAASCSYSSRHTSVAAGIVGQSSKPGHKQLRIAVMQNPCLRTAYLLGSQIPATSKSAWRLRTQSQFKCLLICDEVEQVRRAIHLRSQCWLVSPRCELFRVLRCKSTQSAKIGTL